VNEVPGQTPTTSQTVPCQQELVENTCTEEVNLSETDIQKMKVHYNEKRST
jgi:hypothetical protein